MMPIRTAGALALVGALVAPPLTAQLPLLTAPSGTLRIELGGAFFPTDRQFADGTRRDLGAPLTTSALGSGAIGLVSDLESRLAPLLGRPAAAASLGGVTTIAERQRGVGTIGLGWGITRRITLAARLPIVSVRTQVQLTHDPSGATLGLNPGDPFLGSVAGLAQNTQFFDQFGAALGELATRAAAGEFAGDPALQALAQQTLADGPTFRTGLEALLLSTPVLPALGTTDGDALLASADLYRTRLSDVFGISGFSATPALPAAPLTAGGFDALLAAPSGFALVPFGEDPRVGFGDVELELTASLLERGRPGDAHWLGVWGHGGVTVPTGTPPRPDALLDQGTGDGQLDITAGVSVEAGRGAFGVRGTAAYRLQQPGEVETRIGARDALLRAAGSTAMLQRDPGVVVSVQVQPFVRLAPRLAIVGAVQWWTRGTDRWSWGALQAPLPGRDPAVLEAGSGASATRLGIGLSYVHDGTHRDATGRMPVEAAFGIERTIQSGSGVVDAPMTARVTLRLYKALTGRPSPP